MSKPTCRRLSPTCRRLSRSPRRGSRDRWTLYRRIHSAGSGSGRGLCLAPYRTEYLRGSACSICECARNGCCGTLGTAYDRVVYQIVTAYDGVVYALGTAYDVVVHLLVSRDNGTCSLFCKTLF